MLTFKTKFFFADSIIMNIGDVFAVLKELILDWRVIAAFVVVLLYLNFIFYVSRYKKPQGIQRKIIIKRKKTEDTPIQTEVPSLEESSQ